MTTNDFSNNPALVAVVRAFVAKRQAEAALDDARDTWITTMIAARDAGVSVADISRATGVTSPNVSNTIKTAREKRERLG